ncbi:MOSC domain-containing protein [Haloferula sp. BvORR071]|uniref:MOSC domain-containing protein n=1 Tax=Haloferula sp. BvORR071 TaxID=1396141 RepID=UPI002240EFC6|nr:MOSC domain-containing protein [Haloferula sp. BvORR071]
MKFVRRIEAIAGKGLDGDRYALGTGSYSKSKGIREVTLIEIEALWNFFRVSGIDLHPGLTRRNIVTEGIQLSDLVGSSFSIGPVSFLGLRPCPPCRHLAKLIGMPEVLDGLAHSGGIYAQVLSGGPIRIDDPVILDASLTTVNYEN